MPIPGSHRIARLKSHSACTDLSLHADDIAQLDRLLDPASVAGAGYPEAGLAGGAGCGLTIRHHPMAGIRAVGVVLSSLTMANWLL